MRPVFVLRTGTEFRVDIAILSLHENAEKIKSAAVFFTEKSQKSLLRPPSCKKQPSRSTLRNSLAVQDSVDRLHAGGVFHRHRTARFVGQTLDLAGVGRAGGQGEHEPAPLALLAFDPDLAARQVDQHLADVQAQTCAAGVEAAGAVFLIKGRADGLPLRCVRMCTAQRMCGIRDCP